MLFQESA